MKDLPLRPLGCVEKYFVFRNQVKFYNNIEVGATYTVPGSLLVENTLESLIYSALAETLKSHPILGATIKDEQSTNPTWVRVVKIDFGELVKFLQEELPSNSSRWIEAGHREPLDKIGELPLWRVVVACQRGAPPSSTFSFTMAFFCHHAIGDGLSAGAFNLSFLDALNYLVDHPGDIASNSVIEVPKLSLLPNLELLTPLPVSLPFMVKEFCKTYIYKPDDPLEWSGPPIDAAAPRPPLPNIRSFSLTQIAANTIVSRCRAEKTTVTALVMILTARWLATTYSTQKRFCGKAPVSLRKFSKNAHHDMGCYVTEIGIHFSSETKPPQGYIACYTSSPETPAGRDSQLWEAARACKAALDKRSSTATNHKVGLLPFVRDYAKFFLRTLGTKREFAFEVSNLGVLDGGVKIGVEKKDRATFDRATFSTSLCTYGNPYTIFVVTAKNGYMTLSMGWETGIMSDEEALHLLEWLEMELRGLAER